MRLKNICTLLILIVSISLFVNTGCTDVLSVEDIEEIIQEHKDSVDVVYNEYGVERYTVLLYRDDYLILDVMHRDTILIESTPDYIDIVRDSIYNMFVDSIYNIVDGREIRSDSTTCTYELLRDSVRVERLEI